MNEKLLKLLENQEFIEKLKKLNAEMKEKVKELISKEGIEISEQEFNELACQVKKNIEKLPAESLKKAAGGGDGLLGFIPASLRPRKRY